MQEEKRTEPTDATEKIEATNDIKNNGDKGPSIKKGKIDSISIYEVTDDELTQLKNGSPFSMHLHFLTFWGGGFFSSIIALLTTKFNVEIMYQNVGIIIIVVVSFIMSVEKLIWWLKSKKTFPDVIKKIKSRIQ